LDKIKKHPKITNDLLESHFAPDAVAVEEPIHDSAPEKRALLKQLIRFGVVGAINTAVDLAVLNLLILLTHTGRTGAMFALYKTIAFVAAVLNSYLMNRSWTFQRSGEKHQIVEGAQFLLIAVLGAVVNVGSAWWVVTFAHPVAGLDSWWPSVAALVGTGFSLGFNFIGYKFWVFKNRGIGSSVK
jgi:putative flippase GtrA